MPVDFTIESKPAAIYFKCPHCEEDVRIDWSEITPPEYWGDTWDDVECPHCGKFVILGDWDYD